MEKDVENESKIICSEHCGSNTICHKNPSKNGSTHPACECKPNYIGTPILGCRPGGPGGCLLNSDCPVNQGSIKSGYASMKQYLTLVYT